MIFNFKYLIFFIIISIILKCQLSLKDFKTKINNKYLEYQTKFNFSFYNSLDKKIKIGIYSIGLKYGGTERITSLLLNYIYKIKIFKVYLFTKKEKEGNEYFVPQLIERYTIKSNNTNNLIKRIKRQKLDIFIYQFSNYHEINKLNKLKNLKILFYNHFSFSYWFYFNVKKFIYLYQEYQKAKYIISIVPFENDYLFERWGINSILMNNFITYDYNSTFASDLSSRTIIMIGRIHDRFKRFDLGINSMEYIIQEIEECRMNIISNKNDINIFDSLVYNLNLGSNIKFIGYTSYPENFFKNASLHIFPSISEAFSMVLSECKIYGIPTILLGIDYMTISKGGNIIIYDDIPETLAEKAIKILTENELCRRLGIEARKSMKEFNNNILAYKWIKLLLSIYNDNKNYYQKLKEETKKLLINESIIIINNQIKLLKKRENKFSNININDFQNFNNSAFLISL